MDKLKEWLGIAKPGGVDDIIVRAVKTAIAVFAVQVLRSGLDNIDAGTLTAAGDAAWVAGATIVLNALALLAPGEAGQKTEGPDVDEDVDV